MVTNHAGATLRGGGFGVYVQGVGGQVTNDGTIIGGHDGIGLSGGSTIANGAGAYVYGFDSGVLMTAGGQLANAGTMVAAGADGIGVEVFDVASITNQSGGTISGGAYAVQFDTGDNNSGLTVDPGAVFLGKVAGGYYFAGQVTTLELASGASAGTLSELGSQFFGFTNVTIDSCASWTLSAAALPVRDGYAVITDSGTLTNIGILGLVVTLTPGAMLTNAAGGTITGTLEVYSAGTVVNAGVITSAAKGAGVTLSAAGSLINAAGRTIIGSIDAAVCAVSGTVVNDGIIENSGQPAVGPALYVGPGGSVTNQRAARSTVRCWMQSA